MKRIYVLGLCLLWLFACSDKPDSNPSGTVELTPGQRVTGTIGNVGEVDWYHYRAIESNTIVTVNCSSNTVRPDVDLLVTVYRLDENGNKVRIYGDHAPEGSQLPADIKMNIFVDRPKDLYFAVRDLMDDESSESPYYLSIAFSHSSEDNDSFSQALLLDVDSQSCQTDNIGYIGDVDTFTFNAATDGVYALDVDFTPFGGATEVALDVEVFDGQGNSVAAISGQQKTEYDMLLHLTAGTYYVLIQDVGKDDYDPASTYQVCLNSVAADEVQTNDDSTSATVLNPDPTTGIYAVYGNLAYTGDQDWYRVALNAPDQGFSVMSITFDDTNNTSQTTYQIRVMDALNNILLSHNFTSGSGQYQTQIKVGQGDHYISISPVDKQILTNQAPYTVTAQITPVVDPDEALGNNTIDTAMALTPSATVYHTGKIGFRGDEDWYYIRIDDTTQPHILEVYLDTDSVTSPVDYYVSVLRDQIEKKVYNAHGEDGPTDLKTSVLVPKTESGTPLVYSIKVADYQSDEGDPVYSYRIRVNLENVPTALPGGKTATYYNDINGTSSTSIEVEHSSLNHKTYNVNTTALRFNDPVSSNNTPGIVRTEAGGLTTIVFPWVGGYIDYQSNQDWYELDLGPLYNEGSPVDQDWYYDIKVEFYSPGSDVEYVWKLFRDSNQNQILVDRPNDSSGFFASAGDLTTTKDMLDIVTPDASSTDPFWVGDAWEGKLYFNVSDFNYIAQPFAEDDWGYDAPYYFRITLVYHPGVSRPAN